jgi:hypothetical protein
MISVPELSSHYLIHAVCPIEICVPVEKVVNIHDYSLFSLENMLPELCSKLWVEIYSYININSKIETFNAFLLSCWGKVVPLRNINIKNRNNPWINKSVVEMIKKRNMCLRRYKNHMSPENWVQYKFITL